MTTALLVSSSRRIRFGALPLLLGAALLAACGGGTDPGDTTPPTLVSATTDGVDLVLVFSEEINVGTISAQKFSITPGTPRLINATLVGTSQVTMRILDRLPSAPPTTYTVTATGIADLAGNVASSVSTSFSFGRIAPVVGAAYRLPDGRAVLINGDRTRFSIFNVADGSFTPSRPIAELPQAGISFPIGASATRHDGSLTYYWGSDGDTYIGYGYAAGAVSPAAPISFIAAFADCTLPGGVGAAFTLGDLSSSPHRIYLFSADGKTYRIWSYALSGSPCGSLSSFPGDFGGGGSPVDAVGAGFFAIRGSLAWYYLFDAAGTSFTIYVGNQDFSALLSTADLGDGTLSFD